MPKKKGRAKRAKVDVAVQTDPFAFAAFAFLDLVPRLARAHPSIRTTMALLTSTHESSDPTPVNWRQAWMLKPDAGEWG